MAKKVTITIDFENQEWGLDEDGEKKIKPEFASIFDKTMKFPRVAVIENNLKREIEGE